MEMKGEERAGVKKSAEEDNDTKRERERERKVREGEEAIENRICHASTCEARFLGVFLLALRQLASRLGAQV